MSSGGVYTNTDKCGQRRDDDFYPTPWEATEAFARAEVMAFRRFAVWEPACGDGAISEVLKEHGCTVVSTDLVNRGYGQGRINFLDPREVEAAIYNYRSAIITNPPFHLAEDFIRRAHSLRSPYTAMLLKAHYFHAGKRLRLFDEHPPSRIYPLSWRIDFTGGGSPHTDCSWYVWDKAWPHGYTRYMAPLAKPDPLGLSAQARVFDAPGDGRTLSLRERGESPRQLRMTPAERERDAEFERHWRTLPVELRGRKSQARREWLLSNGRPDDEAAA
jgi:hypothetical protein